MDVLGDKYCSATKTKFDEIFHTNLDKYFADNFTEFSQNRKQFKFFKVTDLVYGTVNTTGTVNIYMLDSDIGFSSYGKVKADSDWNIRVGVIVKFVQNTTGLNVPTVRMYNVNPWFLKTIEMDKYTKDYISDLNMYKMFESTVIDVDKLITDTSLDTPTRFSNQCKICSNKKNCDYDTNDILSVSSISHKMKVHALQENLTRSDLAHVDQSKLSKYDRGVGMNVIHNEDALTKDMTIEQEFFEWFENHPLNTLPENEIAMFDFETTTPLLPIVTNLKGSSDLPLVISINNKGSLSPLLYSADNHELNQYNWYRDFILELNKFQICVAYNAPFEAKQIKAIIKWINSNKSILPDTVNDTIAQAESVISKITEIADPFKKKMIKIKNLYGGWSLKSIIKPFTGMTPYGKQVHINNGLDAVYKLRDVLMYRWFSFGYSEEYINEILNEVESYCDSDTEELWNILKQYKKLLKGKRDENEDKEKMERGHPHRDVHECICEDEHLPF